VSPLPGVLLVLAAGAVEPPLPPEFERPVEVAAPGLTAVVLDRHVYEAAREDLGDLRILDAHGDDVPYVLDRGRGEPRPEVRPRMRNRGHHRDRSAAVVLDFGARVEKDCLVLELNGGNFRRQVQVEGSDDGESWTTLVEETWVFAVPGPPPARYETVALPWNDFPLLRVTVHPGQRERMRLEILGARVPAGGPRGQREATVVPRWSRAAEARPGETWLTLDLGARHQPFEAVVLEVADERFFREVRTQIRRDVGRIPPDGPGRPPLWDPLGRDVVFRVEGGGDVREKTRIEARGRSRGLRVRVLNGDDRPLVIEDVRVRVPVERVVFEAESGDYRLAYGSSDLTAPEYDLARTLDDSPEVAVADLGPPVRRHFEADVLPWSERHPVFLWIGLVVVVAALTFVTWRALRSV
jgi:hypothetical protein